MTLREFQQLIERQYLERDRARGLEGTFMYFAEEVGELATALRESDKHEQEKEFADVLAWLVTLASLAGVDIEKAAVAKYGAGCPVCKHTPCDCKSKQ